MTAFTDETPGEFLVVAKVGQTNHAIIGPVYPRHGQANREAIQHARNNPGMEVAVWQLRTAHTFASAGD